LCFQKSILIYHLRYYFDGHGKAVRPVIAMTLGHAVNHHFGIGDNVDIVRKQRKVAIISEMIHTASLVHDDVLGRLMSVKYFCQVGHFIFIFLELTKWQVRNNQEPLRVLSRFLPVFLSVLYPRTRL
jgi:hypothetical protein